MKTSEMMVKLLDSKKVKRGLVLELPLAAMQGIKEDALRMPAPTDALHVRNFLSASLRSVTRHLCLGLLSVFNDIRNGRINPSTILIENAPIDEELPATPDDGHWPKNKRTYVSEFALSGFMQLLGVPFGLASEKDGKLWSQIVAAKGKEFDRSSLGAKTKLGFHSELVALTEHGLRCDWLGLIGLRSDKAEEAITSVVDIRDVLLSLSPNQVNILSEPHFKFKIPNSFQSNNNFSSPMPLLQAGTPYQMNVNFSLGMTKIIDNHIDASCAFEHVDLVMETADVVQEFKLKPGNLLIMNNLWAAHGRSIFQPEEDGFGRWLQRMYVKADLFQARNRIRKNDYLIY